MNRRTFRRSAFTLVELLVVVAIISIVAALLMPAITMARSHANAVECMSNLRQIGMGFQGYADDWTGFLPPAETSNSKIWFETLAFYVDVPKGERSTRHDIKAANTVIRGCPVFKGNRAHFPGYGKNPQLGRPHTTATSNLKSSGVHQLWNLETIDKPSSRLLVQDSEDRFLLLNTRHDGWGSANYRPDHRGKTNGLFVDGHIARLTYWQSAWAMRDPSRYVP